jgi:hypothetical protein
MAAGAAVLLVIILVALYFQKTQDPAAQLAFKARRVELVEQMRVALASASEAEKSAVMATTDADSKAYADQARAAAATVEQGRQELGRLLAKGGTGGEKDVLSQFSQAFAEFQRIDNDLLSLAVQNTNLKAYSLAFGPAAEAIGGMDAALGRLVAARGSSVSADDLKVVQLADGARLAALRLLALLPPHIAEESDAREDQMEAVMAKEDEAVRRDLQALAAMSGLSGNADLAAATARYARFAELRTQIIKLSRENTNVRSLTISLNQKRKVTMVCQEALAAIGQAIKDEPIPGLSDRTVIRPR